MFNKKLYNTKFHEDDISKYSFLITGGAGFIGSNLVEYLLKNNAGKVRILDNLSNGYYDNIKEFLSHPNFEFLNGDICDLDTCIKALEGIDYVSHQAALGSVPRSINDPILSNHVNISGFLNMLVASKNSKTVKRFVYAASSSTYGDSKDLPKVEGKEGKPLSPYAVTKAVNEMYADVFSKVYNFNTIGLRYFNVFGPKQNFNNPYAAVIPLFCKAFLLNQKPIINGDGFTTRDFTFIENVIQANIKSLLIKNIDAHLVMNTACGDQVSLNNIIDILKSISGKDISPEYKDMRIGDVRHSKASIDLISEKLNYEPNIKFERGLEIVYEWYKNYLNFE